MRFLKLIFFILIFNSSLQSYTSIGNKPDIRNSKSEKFNGSCGYISSGYAKSVYDNYYVSYDSTLGSCTSTDYDNNSEILSLNSNPDFIFESAILINNFNYSHCETNGLESVNGSFYAIGYAHNELQCTYNFIGTCPSPTIYNDDTGKCESSPECIPPQILSDDGLECIDPPECIPPLVWNNDLAKCSHPNDSDGDGIPDDYDPEPNTPLDPEGAPTCEELRQIAESKCNYNHEFNCENGPPAYVTKDFCFMPRSPCEEELEKLKRNCDTSTHELDGNCYDNGLYITKNTLKCELKPDLPPDCDRTWHEVLNVETNECECASGSTMNTFGDCWKSDLDENSTQDEIDDDYRQQDENNENKKELEEEKKQQTQDNNNTAQSLVLDNTRNDTLKGIREDLNKTNSLLSLLNDKDDNDSLSGYLDPDYELASDYDHADNFLNTITNSLDGIQLSFINMKSKIDEGFFINIQSGGSAVFSTTALGKNISVDFCEFLPTLAPIFYFIFYISFLILSIKLFYLGFKVV